MIFMLCLSISHADYDNVQSVGDYIVFDGKKAIKKNYIYKIEQVGSDVEIYFTSKANFIRWYLVKDITFIEVLEVLNSISVK